MSLTSLNSTFYLGQNTDVLLARVDPVQHYLQFGAREGRNPSQAFNTTFYLLNNPDVRAAGVNPLQHFEQFGINEGRAPTSAGKFDATAYLAANTDVAGAVGAGKAFASAFEHYAKFGVNENRPGTPTSGNQSGQTFTLNTTADVFNGTSGADVVRGVAGAGVGSQDQSTLNSSDVLDGGAGVDSLVLLLSGNYGGGATIKNFETLQIGTNLAAASFDYNVNAGAFEVTGVTKILADQINTGEALTVNNITKSAGTTGDIPTLAWVNEANSLAGTTAYNFRTSATDGADTKVTVDLTNVRGGTLTLGSGVETIQVNSNGTGNSVQLIDSTGQTATAVTLVAAAGAPIGAGFAVSTAAATKGLEEARTPTITNTDHLSFVNVGANVVKVDASTSTAAVNVRFIDTATAKDNTFTGGAGDDRVIVALGNDSLAGGAGNDTIIFNASTASSNGSVFNNSDTIDGGAGTDTLIFGDPTGRTTGITFGLSEFQNSKGVDAIDLRGQNNKITLDDGFIGRADAASFEVMTNRIVQNDSTSSVSDEGTSRHLLDATSVSASRALKISGGEGRESVVVTDALNGIMTVSGGNGLDALVVRNAATLTGQDLANVSGVNVMNLVKTGGAQTFSIDLNAAFVTRQIDTNATNVTAAATANVFQIVTDTRDTNGATLDGIAVIGAGDTVNITVDKSSLATGAINLNDILKSGANVTVKHTDNTVLVAANNGVITTAGTSIFAGATATDVDFITTPAAGVGAAVAGSTGSSGTTGTGTTTGGTFSLTATGAILSSTAATNVSATAGVPNLTTGNDTINVVNTVAAGTANSSVISDASTSDNDVANITYTATPTNPLTFINVETINAALFNTELALAASSGYNTINVSGSGTATLSNMLNGRAVSVAAGTQSLTASTATDTATNTLSLTVNGVTGTWTNGTAADTNDFDQVTLTSSGAANTLTLGADDFNDATTELLTISGTQNLTLIATAAQHNGAYYNATALATPVFTVAVSDGAATINMANMTGVDLVDFQAAGATTAAITGIASGQAFRFSPTTAATTHVTPTFTGGTAAVSGNADVISVTFAGGTTNTGNITATSLETLNLASSATAATTAGTITMTASPLTESLIISGGTALTVGAVTADVINASAMTAAFTMTAATVAASGAVVTGASASNNALFGSAQGDSINGGSANDTITAGAGGDAINVGSGTDRVVLSGNTDTETGVLATGFTATTAMDIITGMGTGDQIDLASLGNLTLGNGAIAVGTTFATASANEVVIVSGSYNTATRVFTAGAASATNNDYLLQYNGGATATTVNSVMLLDIVGTVTASSTSEIITLAVA